MTLSHIIAVGLGGMIGAMARYGLSSIIGGHAVLFANIAGCFLIGCLISFFALKTSTSQAVYLFLTIGLLSSFTTFSAFSLETMALIDSQKYAHAAIYTMTSVGGGLIAFIFGRAVVKTLL